MWHNVNNDLRNGTGSVTQSARAGLHLYNVQRFAFLGVLVSWWLLFLAATALAEPTVWPVPFEARAMFPAVLDLARASACKDIAALVDREDYAAALALTEKTMAGPFLWRGALTNGYQQGFCLYALHGLLLEQHGEVVRAYRAYQNSRACFDDDMVMMGQPEPRLEVFAGIGRMCVEAGRYTDALMLLETVRIEGNDQPYLCALADRGLIRRAVEIGDYHDAITNYWDLQAALAKVRAASAPRSATPTLNDGLERDTTNQPIRDQASSIQNPTGINSLSRAEHRELGQLYFWTWRDREGFAQVLDGITLLGIDNDLGVRDPMVDCFLNNIMRADDAEIQRFYDLLGYAITQARALKGDEPFLAALIRVRTAFRKWRPYCAHDNDLSNALARIHGVAAKVGHHAEHQRMALRKTSGVYPYPIAHSLPLVDSTNDNRLLSHSVAQFEEDLMKAEIAARKGQPSIASRRYAALLRHAQFGQYSAAEYDGTSLHNAAHTGASAFWTYGTHTQESSRLSLDGSMRSHVANASSHVGKNNVCTKTIRTDVSRVLLPLPTAHPKALSILEHTVRLCACAQEYSSALWAILQYRERHAHLSHSVWLYHASIMVAQGNTTGTVEALLNALREPLRNPSREMLLNLICKLIPWSSEEQLVRLYDLMGVIELQAACDEDVEMRKDMLVLAAVARQRMEIERQMRAALLTENWQEALALMCMAAPDGPAYSWRHACIYRGVGQAALARRAAWRAYEERRELASSIGGDAAVYPALETQFYEQLLDGADEETILRYREWLIQRIDACEQHERHDDAQRARVVVDSLTTRGS